MNDEDFVRMMTNLPLKDIQQQIAKLSSKDLLAAYLYAVFAAQASLPYPDYHFHWQNVIYVELLRRLPPDKVVEEGVQASHESLKD